MLSPIITHGFDVSSSDRNPLATYTLEAEHIKKNALELKNWKGYTLHDEYFKNVFMSD